MDSDSGSELLATVALLLINRRKRKARGRRSRIWIRPWVIQRNLLGAYGNLCRELETGDLPLFINFSRLFPEQFHRLEELVTPLIRRHNTNYRESISPGERLMLTLRFLATGDSYKSLAYLFRIGHCTVAQIIPETCSAIYSVLKDDYLKCPTTDEEWELVAKGFQEKWNFPNCLGALDGKHVAIHPPPCSGSTFRNYKHGFSVVLMALVDSNYKFLYVDVGSNGRISDGGVFNGCSLQESLERRAANIPGPKPLPGTQQLAPYVVVADEAFPLREYITKPYANRGLTEEQRIFNYRLSRAKRVVENAFGIMANRWRIFLTNIHLPPESVDKIVLACCALHNFLRMECGETYPEHSFAPGGDQEYLSVPPLPQGALPQAALPRSTNPTQQAKSNRDRLCEYFSSAVGAVPWQLDKI